MSKDSKAGQRTSRQHTLTKIIVERHCVGTEKMETVFKRIAEEQLSSIEQFAEQISGYAGITELNFKIINQHIEKNLVSEPIEIDRQKIQRLTIYYKFIGSLENLE